MGDDRPVRVADPGESLLDIWKRASEEAGQPLRGYPTINEPDDLDNRRATNEDS